MISKHKFVFGFVVFLAPASIFAGPISKIDKHAKSADKATALRVPADVAPEIRKLMSHDMNALNAVLSIIPATTIRINVTHGKAGESRARAKDRLNISNRDAAEDAAFVLTEFQYIIDPIREFLEFIKLHKVTARGIVIQSLENQSYREGLNVTDSFLYKFIEQPGSIEEIAAQEIISVQDLHILSKDVEALSGTIMNSLSGKAQNAFDQTRQILIDKKSVSK